MKLAGRILLFVLAGFLVVSCASKPPTRAENPSNLYVEGVNLLNNKKYDKAIEKFSQIRDNFPFDPMALIAAVKMGDAYFSKKEYVLAAGVYEDFFNTHPEDENIPYVLTRLGECYDKLSLSIDRDQAFTLKSIERYTYLVNRFPTSSFAQGVDVKLKVLTQKLVDREIYVGEFYYRTYQYSAALIRLTQLVDKYPNAQGLDKAFYYLAMSHQALGDERKSAYFLEILRTNYPKSPLVKSSQRERRTLKMVKADAPLPLPEEKKRRDIDLRPEAEQKPAQAKKEGGLTFFDEKKPVDILSDMMEGFDNGKYVVFRGNVVAHQEDLWIYTDIIEAYMDEKGSEIERAYARGNVKIVKNERTAVCNEAIFDNRKGEVILKGNVVVFSGTDKLTGDVVTYYINEDRVVVGNEKSRKARLVINPK